jgi:hypothetical protein
MASTWRFGDTPICHRPSGPARTDQRYGRNGFTVIGCEKHNKNLAETDSVAGHIGFEVYAMSLAAAASQMRAVLSTEAVTMRFPSGLKAAERTLSS